MTKQEVVVGHASSWEKSWGWVKRTGRDRRRGVVWAICFTVGVGVLAGAITSFVVTRNYYNRIRKEDVAAAEIALLKLELGAKSDQLQWLLQMKAQLKQELVAEMGLFPVKLIRESKSSFVELNSFDDKGASAYGTANYLGDGYFLTVKHAVIALGQKDVPNARRIVSIKLSYKGKQLEATVVDYGDAQAEVDPGDWAILKVREHVSLTALRLDLSYPFEFADPIIRLGNDYSRGIIISNGYVGQHTDKGLVTCLTDGHPGVSGGGVLNQKGDLVGIPIGRMQEDYRFSFILPIRAEMFRKVQYSGRTTPERKGKS